MQRDTFLSGEADSWFLRNRQALEKRNWASEDSLLGELLKLDLPRSTRILEIGCGDGSRLKELVRVKEWECFGLDPSAQAVDAAIEKGVKAQRGTADRLVWDDSYFDIVVFGFCLYLCDREDLFKISCEADRVLRSPGWLGIVDFYSPNYVKRPYAHKDDVYSYKMDYRTLFSWHPFYECYSHRVISHSSLEYTDEPNDWVGVSLLRKLPNV